MSVLIHDVRNLKSHTDSVEQLRRGAIFPLPRQMRPHDGLLAASADKNVVFAYFHVIVLILV